MAPARSQGFWVTNHFANPALRLLLRGRVGRMFGRRLAVLRYTGRRTGARHELVVQYVVDGGRVWVVPGMPDRKTWWRNFREPASVELWLAGRAVRGRATVMEAPAAADGLAAYRHVFSRAPEDATVVVRIDLSV